MTGRSPLPEAILEGQLEHGSVLVLAPHADDDVLSCGGTASLHAMQGDPVHVIVVFDGTKGDPEGHFAPDELRDTRRAEAHAGGALLGLESYEFWGYPEGHEPAAYELQMACDGLAKRLEELEPDIVYAPWIGEQHVDHHMLARVTRAAIEKAGFRGTAWGWEVWSALVPTRVVDVTKVYPMKVQALRQHRSQMRYGDIVHYGLGLNAHRSCYLPADGHFGEGFAPLGPVDPQDRATFLL